MLTQKSLAIVAILFGGCGVLLCTAAIIVGWRISIRIIHRVDGIVARVDEGLTATRERVDHAHARVAAVRDEFDAARAHLESFAAETRERPGVRAEITAAIDRIAPTLDRAGEVAESLQTVTAGLRTFAHIVDEHGTRVEVAAGLRGAADAVDHAAEELRELGPRVETIRAAVATRLTDRLVELALDAVARSDRLAHALQTMTTQIDHGRQRATEYRNTLARWLYVAAGVTTLLALWGGAGQWYLMMWGRRMFNV